jgi:peptidoglycan hydrolase-like protein with peptidoglycan-binding domain
MKSQAVSKLKTVLIATVFLTALPSVASAADSTHVLARGAGYETPTGSPHVKLLQRQLRLVGVNPGPIDGRFGPLTQAAVTRYQVRDGLVVDGVAGPQTRTALRHAVKLVGRGAGYGTRHGAARVRKLQRSLRLVGARPGQIDGRFGQLTQAAVERFQRQHGLAATGLAGEATMDVLGREVRLETIHWSVRREPPLHESSRPKAQAHGASPAEAARASSHPQARTRGADRAQAHTGSPARPPAHTGSAKRAPAHSGSPKPAPGPAVPEVAAKAPPERRVGRPEGAGLTREELILFAAALLLATAAAIGLPEKVARRIAGPPPPAPRPVVREVYPEPDPNGRVVDGSRRPRRRRQPSPYLTATDRGGSTETASRKAR